MERGFTIGALVPIAVAFVVIAFTVSLGSVIIEDSAEDFCDYSWIESDWSAGTSTANNPVTDGKWGCCETYNGTDCTKWYTSSYAINASNQGNRSLDELGSWLPTLALVVIAALIITVLVTYLARGRGI